MYTHKREMHCWLDKIIIQVHTHIIVKYYYIMQQLISHHSQFTCRLANENNE